MRPVECLRPRKNKDEADKVSFKHYTRGNRKRSKNEFYKLPSMNIFAQIYHTMCCEKASILAKEENWFGRGVKEAISISMEEDHNQLRSERGHLHQHGGGSQSIMTEANMRFQML